MTPIFRKVRWWLQRTRREDELREELQFHLAEEEDERRAEGMPDDEAARAARRDLGNVTLVREDARSVWSWVLLEQLAQDIRYGLRGMRKDALFTALAALSLALGIGANTAIFSFMDAILLRSLPVADPASLMVVKWRSQPLVNFGNGRAFVMYSGDGSTYADGPVVTGPILPYPAFEQLREVSGSVLSSLFAYKPAGRLNAMVDGAADLAQGEFVTGDFFSGLSVVPAAGRPIASADDRAGAPPVAVLSLGYSERRFGDASSAIGRAILINNLPFTVVGVAPADFFGVDPESAPQVYLPMRTKLLLQRDPEAFTDPNYYWLEMMGRLRPGVGRAQAEAALAAPFAHWVAATASNDQERANLPVLYLEPGAAGLDSLRRQFSKPLYVLLTMVGLILAIACANTANLLLARAAARTRELAVRLSLGAGRWRIVRQLLTESVLLSALSGAFGVLIAVLGIRVLTALLANGREGYTLHAELNWHVLGVTLALSCLCGVLFGLAPALQATRPSLMPRLRDRAVTGAGALMTSTFPRVTLSRALVVGQFAVSLLLLVAAGLFVRTLANLQSIPLGFNRDHVLLFELNAPQAGYSGSGAADFYADLRQRLSGLPGVRDVTLSHASLIRAGRSHPVSVNGQRTERTRVLWTGPQFFTTMQIPIVRGREIVDGDRRGHPLVAVVSQLFAKTNFGDSDPVGRHLAIGGSLAKDGVPLDFEIVGVAAEARYGPLKRDVPPVVYVPYTQVPDSQVGQMTFALRTAGDPLGSGAAVRQAVRDADARVPITNIKTQAEDIDQTINQEIVFARLCSAFAILALVIACVGLYATMAYAVARRTNEIGLRMALGAERGTVTWMVLREVCVLAVVGLAIGAPAAIAASRLVETFLFRMTPTDPRTLATAVVVLAAAALAAGYLPARRAARVDPMVALRHE